MKSNIQPQTLSRLVHLRLEGKSLPEIANQLAREGFRTATGGGWYASTIRQYLHMSSKKLVESSAPKAPRLRKPKDAHARLLDLRLEGKNPPEIASQLAQEGYRTVTDGTWTPAAVRHYLLTISQKLTAPSALGAPRRPRRSKAA